MALLYSLVHRSKLLVYLLLGNGCSVHKGKVGTHQLEFPIFLKKKYKLYLMTFKLTDKIERNYKDLRSGVQYLNGSPVKPLGQEHDGA